MSALISWLGGVFGGLLVGLAIFFREQLFGPVQTLIDYLKQGIQATFNFIELILEEFWSFALDFVKSVMNYAGVEAIFTQWAGRWQEWMDAIAPWAWVFPLKEMLIMTLFTVHVVISIRLGRLALSLVPGVH